MEPLHRILVVSVNKINLRTFYLGFSNQSFVSVITNSLYFRPLFVKSLFKPIGNSSYIFHNYLIKSAYGCCRQTFRFIYLSYTDR